MTNGLVAPAMAATDTTLRRNNGERHIYRRVRRVRHHRYGTRPGIAALDYDADGDLDILIANYGAAPILYRNDGGNDANWLRVKTEGTISNRDGIGAFIKVVPDTDHPEQFQVWEVGSGDSYLSQSEMTAHFGLGELRWECRPGRSVVAHKRHFAADTSMCRSMRRCSPRSACRAITTATWWWMPPTTPSGETSLGMTGTGLPADGAGPTGFRTASLTSWTTYAGRRILGGRSESAVAGGDAAASVPEPRERSVCDLALVRHRCRFVRRRERGRVQRSNRRSSMTRRNWRLCPYW